LLVGPQEEENHDPAEHAAEIAAAVLSVNDANLGLKSWPGRTRPTTVDFLDENSMLVLEKDNGTAMATVISMAGQDR
jgi:hypothetical protein